MNQNIITLTLSADSLAAIDTALDKLEQEFSGLIALTPAQRRTIPKMGDKSEAFCRQTLAVLQHNAGILPQNYDLSDAIGDLASRDALASRFARLRRLSEKADDTETALGSDVMSAALSGYAVLKVSGKAEGLDGLRQTISARFARSPKSAPAQTVNGAAKEVPKA